MNPIKEYTLIGSDGKPYRSRTPGTVGGHRGRKVYGRFDCSAALQALAKGGFKKGRVFFADEATAIAAGYRPCARCLPEKYKPWKSQLESGSPSDASVNAVQFPIPNGGKLMEELKWPELDMNEECTDKLEWKGRFLKGGDQSEGPFKNIFNAIFGPYGAIKLFENKGKSVPFRRHGPCSLFAVRYNDRPEVIVMPDKCTVYLINRLVFGSASLKEAPTDWLRNACTDDAPNMPAAEFKKRAT